MGRGDVCSGAWFHVQQEEGTPETVADMRAPRGLDCSNSLIVILGKLLLHFILLTLGH